MSNLTHEQLVEKVAAIIDPKSAGDFRAYRPAERLYAESLAKEIIAVIAEETKEPTEAMEKASDSILETIVRLSELREAIRAPYAHHI